MFNLRLPFAHEVVRGIELPVRTGGPHDELVHALSLAVGQLQEVAPGVDLRDRFMPEDSGIRCGLKLVRPLLHKGVTIDDLLVGRLDLLR